MNLVGAWERRPHASDCNGVSSIQTADYNAKKPLALKIVQNKCAMCEHTSFKGPIVS